MPVVDVNIVSSQDKSQLSNKANSGCLNAEYLENFHYVIGSGPCCINSFNGKNLKQGNTISLYDQMFFTFSRLACIRVIECHLAVFSCHAFLFIADFRNLFKTTKCNVL